MDKYIIIHIGLSLLIAFISTLLLKRRVTESPLWIFIYLLFFNLLFPVIGYIVSFILVPIYSFAKKRTYLHNIQTFNKDEFLKSPYPQVQRLFGEGAVISLATTDKDNYLSNKMKGLVFISQSSTKQNNDLIRGLLADQDNEIRLYSFSLLNTKEEKLNKKIAQLLSKLEDTKEEAKKSDMYKKIAFYYWQFVHSGLTETENEHVIIDKVQYYAKKSLEFKKQEEREMILSLLAKTYFKKEDYKKATTYFYTAIQNGLQKSTIIPYLAEIAFKNKDFERIKVLMNEIHPQEKSFLLNQLYTQWSKS